MRKVLVFCIIVLFLGVGFQPALANEIFDVDEDCFDCQPISRVELLKVKLSLIKIEAITNIILSRFSHILEIREKCQEISGKITTFQERINDLSSESIYKNDFLYCTYLFLLFGVCLQMYTLIFILSNIIYYIFPSLGLFIEKIAFYFNGIAFDAVDTASEIDCYWA